MTEDPQEAVWAASLAECDTLEDFNKYIVPHMRTRGDVFLKMAATEAKKRGYRADKQLGIYAAPVEMKLTKGRVVIKVGWDAGVLYAEYQNGKTYSFPGWDEAEVQKIVANPYPDALFMKLKAKYEKIAAAKQEKEKENHGNS